MIPGDIVNVKITGIVGYGAFVEVDDYIGLIHISEFSDNYVKNIHEFVHVGDEIRARVLSIDEENKKINLSYKQLHKTKGVKCKVPTYEVGFKPLSSNLSKWIEDYKKR